MTYGKLKLISRVSYWKDLCTMLSSQEMLDLPLIPPTHRHHPTTPPPPPHHPTTPYPPAHPPITTTLPPTNSNHPHFLAPYSLHETPRFPFAKCTLESRLASHPPHFYWCKPHSWWYYLWCEIFITNLFSNMCAEPNYSLIKFSPYRFISQVKFHCPVFIAI